MANENASQNVTAWNSPLRLLGFGVLLLLAGYGIYNIISDYIAEGHQVNNDPPPEHFLKNASGKTPIPYLTKDGNNYFFEEDYYISIPCSEVDGKLTNRDIGKMDDIVVGIFNGNNTENNGYLLINNRKAIGIGGTSVMASDYTPRQPGGDTCQTVVQVKYSVDESFYAGDGRLKLAFYLKEHKPSIHKVDPPLIGRGALHEIGNCNAPENTLEYYECIKRSNTHGGKHVFISSVTRPPRTPSVTANPLGNGQ